MAVTAKVYGRANLNALNGKMNLTTDTIKVILLTSAYVPDQDVHEFVSSIRANEVVGTGYTAGGYTLANKTLTYTAANSWATARANSTVYAVGAIVRPATGNGYLYRCVSAGTSAAAPPAMSTVSGQDTTDGTAVWTNIGFGIIIFDNTVDPSWVTSTITARYAVFYDDTPATDATKPLIAYTDFGADQISSNGTFTITLDALGIFATTAA